MNSLYKLYIIILLFNIFIKFLIMLNSMSFFSEKENLDIFLKKHRKNKETIFSEIYSYLGNRDFTDEQDFNQNCVHLLSSEKNKKKIIPSGLILEIDKDSGHLILKDEDSSFNIHINYIKRFRLLDNSTNEFKTNYIISDTYYSYYYETVKKVKIKYKFKDCSEESSLLFSEEFEKKIIFSNNLDYIILNPDFKPTYDKIFQIRKKEKNIEIISPEDLFNDFRILNFPDIKKKCIDKIKLKIIPYKDYCWNYRYIVYNKKIGLTLATQKYLIRLYQKGKKYFYCNIDFLFNEQDKKKVKNYIIFYISFLFSDEERKEYQDFVEKNVIKLIFSQKGEKLIYDLLELLYSQFGNTFRLYADNIKTRVQLNIINTFLSQFNIDDVFVLIQINENTLYCLSDIKYVLIDKVIVDTSINNDFEYYIPFELGETNIKKIKKEYSEQLKPFFANFNYDSYLYLLNVKYLIDAKDFDFEKLKDITPFINFLHIIMNHNKIVNEIFFRNDIIKELFNDYYMNYILKFQNINNNIFFEISKTEEGINLERQIIFDLIIKNINIKKIKVKQIFSIKSFPNIEFNNNQEYLFIQESSNASCYDMGYIYNSNGLNIFKACQIGINKPEIELKKLDKEFILFDLFYFCQKIEFEKNIKIDKIDFSLITTYNAYQENEDYINKKIAGKDRKYNHFNNMRKYCNNNKFTFLIFDIETSEFYSYNNEYKIEKKDLKFSAYQYDIKKIFIDEKYIQNTQKIDYTYNTKRPNLLGGIDLPQYFKKEYLNAKFNFTIKQNIAIYRKDIKKEGTSEYESNRKEKIKKNKIEKILNKKRTRDDDDLNNY